MSVLKSALCSVVGILLLLSLNACGGGGSSVVDVTPPVVTTPLPEPTVIDSDGDLVQDQSDNCANTASGHSVDLNGCSELQLTGDINGFKSWGIGGGGAMAGYSINPFDDTMRFVGTDMGTVFRSLSSGTYWTPVSHLQATYSSLLGYASTFGFAGSNIVLHASGGMNPVRSVDGGQTFTAPNSFTLMHSNDGDMTNDEHILGWYSDTVAIGTVYAMTDGGLWRSTDTGNNWQFVYGGGVIQGMFIDNNDDGKTYIATQSSILTATDGINFTNHYTPNGHKIHRFSGGSTSSHRTLTYASDESDKAIEASLLHGLKVGDVKSSYVKPSSAGIEVGAGMIYVSKNGAAFEQSSQFVGSHLLMAQNNADIIYATGSRGWGREQGTSIYVSEDGGDNWQLRLLQMDWDGGFTPWSSLSLEHSQVALNVGWFDAGYYSVNINQLNGAQFGGSGNFFLHGTENTGIHWLDLSAEYKGETPAKPIKSDKWSSSGLNVTTVYDMKFNPANDNDVYAAYADIYGARSTDHGLTWQILPSVENSIYDYAFDINDQNTVFMVNGNEHDWPYRSLSLKGKGGVFKSSNKGDSWLRLTPDTEQYNRQYLSIGYDSARNDIYAGSQSDGISRSVDGGATWQKFNDGLPAVLTEHGYDMDLVIPQIEVMPNGNVYVLVTGIRPEFTPEQVASLGIAEHELITDTSGATTKYFSWINASYTGIYWLDVVNGATRWQLLRQNIDLDSHDNWDATHQPWKRPMSFAVDPTNSNILWLTDIEPKTFQFGASGVWKSVDKGQNWRFMLQHTVALDINVAPNNSQYIVVAGPKSWGNGGVYVSENSGQSWTEDTRFPLQNNANAVCFSLGNSNQIVYGFFGGGMLMGDRL